MTYFDEFSIKELAKGIRGVSYKPHQLQEDITDENFYLLRATNIQNGKLDLSDRQIVEKNCVKEIQKLEIDDIIVCMSNGSRRLVGKSALIRSLDANYCVGAFCSSFRVKENTDPNFVYQIFQSSDFKRQIDIILSGSAINNLRNNQIEELTFKLPSAKTVQTRIAEILSKVDEAIEQTEKLIDKYQRIKTGLMQDLLTRGIDEHGNIRSKATHKFVIKKGIEVPEEWEVDIIDRVCKVTKLAGYEYTKYFDYSVGGEVIALRALNIKNEEIILDDIQTIPKKVSDLLPRSKINKGDVLLTYIGAYIGDVLLIDESDKYHLAPNISKITAGEKLLPEFLEIVLKTYPVQKQTKNLTAVTATPSLTMGQIRNIIIAFPRDSKEQERIIKTINSIKQSIKAEKDKLVKLNSIKTGLIQDLLSGRVRVKVKEN